jgi:hypothetical protein
MKRMNVEGIRLTNPIQRMRCGFVMNRGRKNGSIEFKPRRRRRTLERITELVREFGSSGLTQREFL